MKSLQEVLNDYGTYETLLEDRFGKRLCDFLTLEQMEKIGFRYADEESAASHKPLPWTEQNILAQLKLDVEFGWEKAIDERGISSSLMYSVVQSWCKVLENSLADFDCYPEYGKPLFIAVARLYGWTLPGLDN